MDVPNSNDNFNIAAVIQLLCEQVCQRVGQLQIGFFFCQRLNSLQQSNDSILRQTQK